MYQQLPERPSLDHLRKQAKDLLKAYRSGDATASERLAVISTPPYALNQAQLAVAREHGFASWPALVSEVESVLAKQGIDEDIANRFLKLALKETASALAGTGGKHPRLRRMLDLYPGLPRFNIGCALASGEVDVVKSWLAHASVSEPVGEDGWQPIECVAYSKVFWAAPERYEKQLECARMLLDAGADPNATHLFDGDVTLPVLFGATGESGHLGITRLLLERGAKPNDGESVFHAVQFNRREILEVLLEFGAEISGTDPNWGNTPLYFNAGHRPADQGAATPMRGIEWLLEHGADPNIPSGENKEMPLHAVCQLGWGVDVVGMFLRHGADPNARRADGSTPFSLAALTGNVEVMELLKAHGADTTLTDDEAFLVSCVTGKVGERREFPEGAKALFVRLADLGNLSAVETMLREGMGVAVTGEAGATALHFAAFRGWADVADLLLRNGAPLDVKDSDYSASPLGWALYGMGENRNPKGDYVRTIRLLLAAGADRDEVLRWIDEDESPEELLQGLA